jgi:hypothetical protein
MLGSAMSCQMGGTDFLFTWNFDILFSVCYIFAMTDWSSMYSRDYDEA